VNPGKVRNLRVVWAVFEHLFDGCLRLFGSCVGVVCGLFGGLFGCCESSLEIV